MIKILYANGCSLTEGSELGNVEFGYDEKKYGPNTNRQFSKLTPEHLNHIETHSWPYLLKTKLGIPEHLNAGFGGSSNRRILRTTVEDIETLLRTYDPSEIFVIIGWTSFDRFEFYAGRNEQHFKQVVPSYIPDTFSKPEKTFIKSYDELVNGEIVDHFLTHMTQVLALKGYLESKGIKYLFTYSLTTYFTLQFSKEEIQRATFRYHGLSQWAKQMEYDKWCIANHSVPTDIETLIEEISEFSFYTFSKKKGFKTGNGLHPLEDAHEAWASHIHKYMLNNNVLGSP